MGRFLIVAGRDLRLAQRHGFDSLLVVAFFIIAVVLFPFGVGPEPNILARIAAGIIWVAALLAAMGLEDTSRIVVEGLETRKAFHRFAIEESGTLDPAEVEAEIVDAGRKLASGDDAVGALLLECSLLPPYAAAVQAAVHLPVFDYVTMINFVFSAMVRQPYKGII